MANAWKELTVILTAAMARDAALTAALLALKSYLEQPWVETKSEVA